MNFFLMHQVIGLEKITEDTYERNFEINDSIGFLKLTNQESNLILEVSLTDESSLPIIEQKIRMMFDLDLDPKSLADKFLQHALLKHTYTKYPALRIPGGWDIFETAVNTILSQSISILAARKLLAKLVAKYGTSVVHPISKEKMYLFPTPETLLGADLISIGMTNMKAGAIKILAEKIVNKEINLENNNFEQIKTELLKIKGIGSWTVEYIVLRCSQNKDGFPGNDLILKNYVKGSLNIQEFDGIKSYLAIYLWQHYLTSEQNT